MKKPNIVFILSDDQGEWAMGASGNEEIITPNLDRLAREGIRFNQFFCASPVCSPARASILTGTMPSCHGVMDWIREGNLAGGIKELSGEFGYAEGETPVRYLEGLGTYTEILAKNGYTCALSGKWHLGDSFIPQAGFRKWSVLSRGGCGYYKGDIIKEGEMSFPKEYITDVIAGEALEQLEELIREEGPFYLGVHFTAPHSPWDEKEHPEEIRALYASCGFHSVPEGRPHPLQVESCPRGRGERRRELLRGYFSAVTAMDIQIGRILAVLEKEHLLEDTIVMFTSDNGMNMGHHGIWGKGNGTYPQNMYDTSVKVPCIVSWKNHLPEGDVCGALCSHYDLFPTLLELAGIAQDVEDDGFPKRRLRPGKSLVPLLHRPAAGGDWDRENTETDDFGRVVIFDEYGPVRMLRTLHWKLVDCMLPGKRGRAGSALYNLKDDPAEEENLYEDPSCACVRESMKKALEAWFKRFGDGDIEKGRYFCTGSGQRKSLREKPIGEDSFGPFPVYGAPEPGREEEG